MAQAERDAPPVPRREDRVRARADDLREAVERVIWAEHEPIEAEGPEADDACDRLFGRLEEQIGLLRRDARFAQAPLDEQVHDVRRTLGLDAALAGRWRELPDPEDTFLDPLVERRPAALARLGLRRPPRSRRDADHRTASSPTASVAMTRSGGRAPAK